MTVMSKKVYVMPDTHPVKREYIGNKAREMIEASEIFRKTGTPVSVKSFGGVCIIDNKNNFTWGHFPAIVKFLSETLGAGDYEDKAKIIEAAKPDVLFIESFTSYKELFEQLPFVKTDFIVGALREGKNVFSSFKPVYDACKKSKIQIIPVDNEELVKQIWEIDEKRRSFDHVGNSKKTQDIENELKKVAGKRSGYMLKGISENIAELGENKAYAALVGSQHYENLLKIPETERNVEILHINERLKKLGSNIRYNESDY